MRSYWIVPNEQIQIRRNAVSVSDKGAVKKMNCDYRTEVGSGRGRRVVNLDATLNGIWWVLCTGSMWNQLPGRFGKGNSVWRCFRRWCGGSGLWRWVLQRLNSSHPEYAIVLMMDASHLKVHQDATGSPLNADRQKLGKIKGGRNTKTTAVVNLAECAVDLLLVCGNQHDSKSTLEALPQELNNRFVLGDKGYDTDAIREEVRKRGGHPNIPPKSNRVGYIPYDKEVGKLRHKVENFFCRMKSFRRLSTHFDQLPETYMGFVTLSAIVDWIKFEFVHAA